MTFVWCNGKLWLEAGRGKTKGMRRWLMLLHKLYGVWQVTQEALLMKQGAMETELGP